MRSFHKNIRHIVLQGEQTGKVGKFGLHQVANVDQTPLPFCFADSPTYTDTGDKNCLGLMGWIWTGEVAMYCPDYLGKARVKPLLMFRGKGEQISIRDTFGMHACNY